MNEFRYEVICRDGVWQVGRPEGHIWKSCYVADTEEDAYDFCESMNAWLIPVPDPIPVSDTATKPPDSFPLPWTALPMDSALGDAGGNRICEIITPGTGGDDLSTVNYIVEACNAYPSLVSNLQATVAENKRLREALKDTATDLFLWAATYGETCPTLGSGMQSTAEDICALLSSTAGVVTDSQSTRMDTGNTDGPTAEVATGEASENREGEGK